MATADDQFRPEPYASPDQAPADPSNGILRGCLFGCLFLIISGAALMICAGVGTYWFVSGQVEKYTSTTPAEFPSVEYSEAELTALRSRLDSFGEALDQDQTPGEDLVLTAKEINILIADDDQLRGKLFVRIDDGKLTGDVSIPTDPIPGGKGRYFNGSATLEVSMVAGDIFVTLVDAEVNGEPLPRSFIDAMSEQNLAKDVYNNPDLRKSLRRFESISIEDDKIVLKVRRDQPPGPAQESAPPAVEAEPAAADDAAQE